ncbi:MAG: BREX-3 system phosphatase PglZ, partial [Anaerolineae bacterium]|nr:BREX-3 system phosphatase PglZ [Anaerolineae bacterium]
SPLRFGEDAQLQALLPRLVAGGLVPRLPATAGAALPDWARAALTRPSPEAEVEAYRTQLTALEALLAAKVGGWVGWQDIARRWAALTVTRYSPDLTLTGEDWQRYRALQTPLDSAFLPWLRDNYSRLGALALPTPHHVYHVPGWLAHRREAQPNRRVALLIVDGLSLADWSLTRDVWATRHPAWTLNESLLLAQIPSVTAISRQALVLGQRPAQFAGDGLASSREPQGWRAFWTARGVPEVAVAYARLSSALNAPYPADIGNHRIQALCLVTTVIDDLVHGATLGTAEVFGSLRVWLHQSGSQQGSPWLEGLVQQLLDRGYTVTLISDHGHVEAVGAGLATARGLSVSRGQRALLFDDLALASLAPDTDPPTILWHDDGLLPANLYIVMPRGRAAFTSKGSRVVSHGGASIEEMVVPLVTIEGR